MYPPDINSTRPGTGAAAPPKYGFPPTVIVQSPLGD